MIKLFKIEGNSLYPFLKNGQRVLCLKRYNFLNLKIGDFVVFYKKEYGLMVKRISQIKDNKYFVKGTEPFSIDSRDFGPLKQDEIKYKVLPLQKSLRKNKTLNKLI